MKTIANIMCALNEEEFIEAAIRSVSPGVDHLFVIDQGSTDGTVDILKRIGVPYISTRGQNFLTLGEQFFRNLSRDLCFCDWLMVTDADEIMSDDWWPPVKALIDQCGDRWNSIACNYWQMVGSSEFHTLDSPLGSMSGERPLFFRMRPELRSGPPMVGTLVHNVMEGGAQCSRLAEVDCFHMGYTKADLTKRWERNIERGDWTQDEAEKAKLMEQVKENPFSNLWECRPRSFDPARMPESIRAPKWKCEYNPETMRITGRTPA